MRFLAALATGLLVVVLGGDVQAYTIDSGTTYVGAKDDLLFSTDLGNSGDDVELAWVRSVLQDSSVIFSAKYDTEDGNGWVAVDGTNGFFAHELITDPGYFLIKTGNLKLEPTNFSHFLFRNNSMTGYAVVNLLDMGVDPKDILNVNKISHVDEFNGAPVPEPATTLLFGTGLAGLAGVARRRNKKNA